MHDSSSLETLQNSLNPSKHLIKSKSSEDTVSDQSFPMINIRAESKEGRKEGCKRKKYALSTSMTRSSKLTPKYHSSTNTNKSGHNTSDKRKSTISFESRQVPNRVARQKWIVDGHALGLIGMRKPTIDNGKAKEPQKLNDNEDAKDRVLTSNTNNRVDTLPSSML